MLVTLDELAALTDQQDRMYVRYSRGPEADATTTSRDYESGLELPGLSANSLTPESWWTRPRIDWVARQLCQYVHLEEESDEPRCAWVLRGPVVGRGPDCEPLIRPTQPVAVIDPAVIEEAKRHYTLHFDVGRDSTG